MKILVTGASGFIARNLLLALKGQGYTDIFEYDIDTNTSKLDAFCKETNFVFHLAGVIRPKDNAEFIEGNVNFTAILLDNLKKHGNTCPVMLSSSRQATLHNPYGQSKKAGEDLIFAYSVETNAKVYVYRFTNIFGKLCRPNYNSAVATFCHNIARGLPIQVNDRSVVMKLVYIDDVVTELLHALNGKPNQTGDFCDVPVIHTITLGEIVDLLYSFKESGEAKNEPDLSDPFTSKLYSTYLSYVPVE